MFYILVKYTSEIEYLLLTCIFDAFLLVAPKYTNFCWRVTSFAYEFGVPSSILRNWLRSSLFNIDLPKLFPPLSRTVKISFAASVDWNIIIPRKMRIHENSVVVVVILIFVVLVSNSLCVVCILQNSQVLRRLRKAIADNLFTV